MSKSKWLGCIVLCGSLAIAGCSDSSKPKDAGAPDNKQAAKSGDSEKVKAGGSAKNAPGKSDSQDDLASTQPAVGPEGPNASPNHTPITPVAPPGQENKLGPIAADSGALNTNLIPENAIVAMVAYPARIVAGTQHLRTLAEQFDKDMLAPLPPSDVDSMVSVASFSPPNHANSSDIPFQSGVIVRLRLPHHGEEIATRALHVDKAGEVRRRRKGVLSNSPRGLLLPAAVFRHVSVSSTIARFSPAPKATCGRW